MSYQSFFFRFFIIMFLTGLWHESLAQEHLPSPHKRLVIKFKTKGETVPLWDPATRSFHLPAIDDLNKSLGLEKVVPIGNPRITATYLLLFRRPVDVPAIAKRYLATGLLAYAEPDRIGHAHGVQFTPDDPYYYNRQWSHYNDGTFPDAPATTDADIDTDLAWNITQGSSQTIVAIVDTGVKLDHPEFAGRIWENTDETQDGTDNDANGYIDDIHGGWDFVNNDNDPTDDRGHGTNVAGIALATGNNGTGYAGVNWHAKMMVCKVLNNDGFGYYTWWASGIYYAVDNGAQVINLSAGGDGASTVLEDAVNYAYSHNVSLVVSSGNQNGSIQYPAKYQHAIAVGATDPDDTRSHPFFWSSNSGSNYGPELDFVAPGNYIYGLNYQSDTNYNTYWGGTSQAAPHVAGVISLLLARNPSLTISQIENILRQSAEDQVGDAEDTPGWDQYYGYGRINAYAALQVMSTPQTIRNAAIHLSPNPAIAGQRIRIAPLPEGRYTLNIYDLSGKIIYSQSMDAASEKIMFTLPTSMNKGTYLLNIHTPNQEISVYKKLLIK